MSDSVPTPTLPGAGNPAERSNEGTGGTETPRAPQVETVAENAAALSPAWAKFRSCRWRRPPEDGPECCGHRDVLPIAGTSFNPDAWCPDCSFFKLRRTPKKRSPEDYRY
jgi:hypothetical protein